MKNKTPLLVTALIILALVAAFFGYELNTQTKQNNIYAQDIAKMEDLIQGNGMGDMLEDDISVSLENLLEDYNSVSTDNVALSDSINIQKQKVTLMLKELENSENRRKYTARELFKMKKEAQTLRNVMKNYVYKVDSLNTLNKELMAEMKVKDNRITEVSGERDQFKEKTADLSKTVALGSKLQILALYSQPIRIRSSGSFTETTRAKRADQIKSCFKIAGNTIAEAGSKTFHMRVISPEGKVLTNTKSSEQMIGEESVTMSISRSIDYQNTPVDLCIFYEKSMGSLPVGDYKVEIYTDGAKVGSSTFALR